MFGDINFHLPLPPRFQEGLSPFCVIWKAVISMLHYYDHDDEFPKQFTLNKLQTPIFCNK